MKLFLIVALLLPSIARAQPAAMPAAPAVAAKAYVLYDAASGQVLASQNGDERFEPGSLAKLMTAHLTFTALKLNQISLQQTILPSAEALRVEGRESRMLLDKNKPVSVGELLRGLIVQSGNDAARVLAISIAGSEQQFVSMMNREALRLGMNNTRFTNVTGAPDPQQHTSANDLILLASATVRDFPEHFALFAVRENQYNGIVQTSRNRLLWMDPYADGMGTGYSEGAGFHLLASARRDTRRLLAVIVGAASDALRALEAQKLLNFGFLNFEAIHLYRPNQPAARLRVWKGAESHVNTGFRNGLIVTIPKGQRAHLNATMETRQPLIAPLSGGQKIGTLKLTLHNEPFAEYPLAALDAVPLANIFSRGWDSIRLLFE